MFPTIRTTAARLASAPLVRAVLPLWVATLGIEMFLVWSLTPAGFLNLMLDPTVSASQLLVTLTTSISPQKIVGLTVVLIAIAAFQQHFTFAQFIVALLTLPILITLAEAFSPHTWDSPLIYGVGGITMIGISFLG